MIDHAMRVLYNDDYGTFNFSDAFMAEYVVQTGKELIMFDPRFRCDPIVLKIFDQNGSEWSSGPNASLKVYEFPDMFEKYWEIDAYCGDETVRILYSDALADILDTFMDGGDIDILYRQYAAIKEFQTKSTLDASN
jgi:hypothetical protein